ncbi:MAG: hypothetical protein C7B47_03045 [Sulfobacillus thermosulfidooxidans]|uniref:Glycosyltransferase family 1 protein n=1 Tax=Sulfobacillus thermosulfidooxidans TaxID=28034 RepID=A0A2T2X362_SULTH|nr:MAG: hypothetical protein C7B47_03045 [Sulfobacillus thermosulfidooxidans]
MNIEITIVQPENYVHSLAFSEIMETLAYGFHALGHHVELSRNHVSSQIPTVILGANLLAPEVIQSLPPTAILYNLEQITESSPWITPKWMNALRGKILWDYSLRNIEQWTTKGFTPRYVPVGYAPILTRIDRTIHKDIDVIFYGSLNQRRVEILHALQEHHVTVASLAGVYGKARDEVIARSKLALNIHFYVPNIFEVVRASYLVANRIPVLSERNPDTYVPDEWENLAYWAPYNQLIPTCLELLANPHLQSHADERLKLYQSFPFINFLRTAIELSL